MFTLKNPFIKELVDSRTHTLKNIRYQMFALKNPLIREPVHSSRNAVYEMLKSIHYSTYIKYSLGVYTLYTHKVHKVCERTRTFKNIRNQIFTLKSTFIREPVRSSINAVHEVLR